MQMLCSDYIRIVTDEAQKIVDKEGKNTLKPEHIKQAIHNLKLDNL